jgi:hypothetical protein
VRRRIVAAKISHKILAVLGVFRIMSLVAVMNDDETSGECTATHRRFLGWLLIKLDSFLASSTSSIPHTSRQQEHVPLTVPFVHELQGK